VSDKKCTIGEYCCERDVVDIQEYFDDIYNKSPLNETKITHKKYTHVFDQLCSVDLTVRRLIKNIDSLEKRLADAEKVINYYADDENWGFSRDEDCEEHWSNTWAVVDEDDTERYS